MIGLHSEEFLPRGRGIALPNLLASPNGQGESQRLAPLYHQPGQGFEDSPVRPRPARLIAGTVLLAIKLGQNAKVRLPSCCPDQFNNSILNDLDHANLKRFRR